MARARVDCDEWRRRIQRWKDSGLTAKEFAAEMGNQTLLEEAAPGR
jgi:hypothetical protein